MKRKALVLLLLAFDVIGARHIWLVATKKAPPFINPEYHTSFWRGGGHKHSNDADLYSGIVHRIASRDESLFPRRYYGDLYDGSYGNGKYY